MKKPTYQILLTKANHDLKIARSELNTIDPVLDLVCFHLQQYVEKNMKAFLIYNKVIPPRTHNLSYLLQEAINIHDGFDKYLTPNISELSECAVEVRYEDIEYLDIRIVNEIIEEIISLRNFIDSLIR